MASNVHYMNIGDGDDYEPFTNNNQRNTDRKGIKDKLISCFNNTISNIKYYSSYIDKEKTLTILKFSYLILFLYNFILFINSKNMSFFYLFNISFSFIILIIMNIITNTFDIFYDQFVLSEFRKTLIFLIIVLIFFSFIDILVIYISKMTLNIPNSSIIKAGFSVLGQLIISLLYVYILFKTIISKNKKKLKNIQENNSDLEQNVYQE